MNNTKNAELIKQMVFLQAMGKIAGNSNTGKNIAKLIGNLKKKRNEEPSHYGNVNIYRNSSGRVRSIPEPTPFYNQHLRRFLYRPSVGFYIILGLDRNGKAIKKRVPGHFYYRYDEKLARIIPFRRRSMRPVPHRKTEKEREEERRRERERERRSRNNNNNNNRNAKRRRAL